MKKPYIYNFAVWYFHDHARLFVASFLLACAMIPAPNKVIRWIGIYFMAYFIILAIAGGIDFFIHKMRNRHR